MSIGYTAKKDHPYPLHKISDYACSHHGKYTVPLQRSNENAKEEGAETELEEKHASCIRGCARGESLYLSVSKLFQEEGDALTATVFSARESEKGSAPGVKCMVTIKLMQ